MSFQPPQAPPPGGQFARIFTQFNRRELLHHIKCPECGVAMVQRQNPRGDFYGCSRYPVCIGTRPGGEGVDSYTRLLRDAYTKAIVFLASPAQLGASAAAPWLLSAALGEEADPAKRPIYALANSVLERAIDIANAYVQEKGNDLDFLLLAHEERMAAARAHMKYELQPDQLRRIPPPAIVRRYDDSEIARLEANISQNWKQGGRNCPRCGQWSERKAIKSRRRHQDAKAWDCGNCGMYLQEHSGSSFLFERDAEDKDTVHGTNFGPTYNR